MSAVIAAAAFVAVLLSLVTALLGLLNQRRARVIAEKVQSISIQVNGHLSALLERQDQLLGTLQKSGIPIPPPVPPAAPPDP